MRMACGPVHLPASNWDKGILSTMQVLHHILHYVLVSYIVKLASGRLAVPGSSGHEIGAQRTACYLMAMCASCYGYHHNSALDKLQLTCHAADS